MRRVEGSGPGDLREGGAPALPHTHAEMLVDPRPTGASGLRVGLTASRRAYASRLAVEGLDVVTLDPDRPLPPGCDVVILEAAEAARVSGTPAVLLGATSPPLPGDEPRAYLDAWPSFAALAAAIRAVAAGLTVYAATTRRAGPGGSEAEVAEALTPRELDVLRAMARGLPNKGIARELGISENTAKYHVAAVLAKLEAQSRADAVMKAARRGLIAL